MTDPGNIRISDFDYTLPEERIAQFPLKERDDSRLLVWKEDLVSSASFHHIGEFLPDGAVLVFNNTRVIRARLKFSKPSGSQIEIFCLEPVTPTAEIQQAFRQTSGIGWNCLVGNLNRWKSGSLERIYPHPEGSLTLRASRSGINPDGSCVIDFTWNPPAMEFSQVLERAGQIPLPPYIHRSPETSDSERYQTIYARHEGSVAAPTAGLHFTGPLMDGLKNRGIGELEVTLHVGIGTFKPVMAEVVSGHQMHSEHFSVTRQTIRFLVEHRDRPVIAVGTTSARTLESLYWFGAKLCRQKVLTDHSLNQWEPYRSDPETDCTAALSELLSYLDRHDLDTFSGETSLMIIPGFKYRVISGLVTNFHMPKSTLLLLVAALIGESWKKAYEYALEHGFRFLSYGDSCLFLCP